MVGLFSRDDWSISDQREVDTRIGHQVGLELSEIHIKSTIEPERGSDGGDNLANQPVEIGVGWPLNIQVTTADVIDCLIIYHEGAVRVLQSCVCCQDGVVGFDYSSGDLGSWIKRERTS